MEIDNLKYDYNLISTLSITASEMCRADFSREKYKINYSDSISLYKIAELFNMQYKEFKDKLDKLPKLDFRYFFDYYERQDYKSLDFVIDDPFDKNDEALLRLYEENGEVFHVVIVSGSFVNVIDHERTKKIEISKTVIKDYLDLAHEYSLLLESYKLLRNKTILVEGSTMLSSKIGGGIFNDLKTFELFAGNLYFNGENYVDIFFELGDELKIDYEKSKAGINDKVCSNKEIINNLAHDLYINRTIIPKMFLHEKGKKLVKELH